MAPILGPSMRGSVMDGLATSVVPTVRRRDQARRGPPLRLASLGTSPHFVGLEDGRRRLGRAVLHPTQWGRRWRRAATTEGGRRMWRSQRRPGGTGLVVGRIAGTDGEAWIPDTSSFAALGRRSGMTKVGGAGRILWPSMRGSVMDGLATSVVPTVRRPGLVRRGPPLRLASLGTSVPFLLRFLDARRGSRDVKRSGTERDPRATARIGVAFPNRADPSGATNHLLWPDHLGGTRAPTDWP